MAHNTKSRLHKPVVMTHGLAKETFMSVEPNYKIKKLFRVYGFKFVLHVSEKYRGVTQI